MIRSTVFRGAVALGLLAPLARATETAGSEPTVRVSGFVQAQLQGSELSEDQLQQGGAPLNQDRFVLRRGRLRARRDFDEGFVNLEVDASTVRGAGLTVRRAEVAYVLRSEEPSALPLLTVLAGVTDIPFGYELLWPQEDLLFVERTTGSVALFPGLADVGVKALGALGAFRYAAAVTNGTPLDDRSGALPSEPTHAPDVSARLGVDTHPGEGLRVESGASFLTGTGFSPGSDATKSGVVWRDVNGNGSIDLGEIFPVSPSTAKPSRTFKRWALGADATVHVTTVVGTSKLGAELVLASNLDRGLFASDPIATGRSLRQVVGAAWLTHEWGPLFFGFRADLYAPDLDAFDFRRGRTNAVDTTITTLAPLAGVRIGPRVRLTAQANFVADQLGVDARGVPTDLANDSWTLRAQGAF
jgi:hypothetical protein